MDATTAGPKWTLPLSSAATNVSSPELRGDTSIELILGLLLALFFIAGCAGYRVGPTNGQSAGARTVEVIPFQNQTVEPRWIDVVTRSVRKELQRDGTYRLAGSSGGEIVIEGTLVRFVRQHLSFQARDILTPRDYRVVLTAHVVAREKQGGRILLDREVSGKSTVRVGSDLESAERQAMPLIADDLAHNVTALLVDGSW